jgi:hypothetical protein
MITSVLVAEVKDFYNGRDIIEAFKGTTRNTD